MLPVCLIGLYVMNVYGSGDILTEHVFLRLPLDGCEWWLHALSLYLLRFTRYSVQQEAILYEFEGCPCTELYITISGIWVSLPVIPLILGRFLWKSV